ncbi:MAG TPA: hypothetical protein VNZ05_00170 [Solirubrobacteraceae bacterium]|jgi:plastocyanin|nr:hypothetical protein [Solirubrobacteraceae bacterium]
MSRRRPHALALLALGACALTATAALAGAAAGSGSAHHGARCKARSHTRQRSRHHAHCAPARRRAAGHPGASSGALGGGGSGGTSSSPPPAGAYTQTPPPPTNAAPGGPPSVPHVQVVAVEYHFSLSRTTVPAGKVILQFVNHGQDEHNLNVAAGDGSLAGWFANAPASAMASEQFELRPGSYTLFCSLPEHEQKGMKATLLVQ